MGEKYWETNKQWYCVDFSHKIVVDYILTLI